MSSNDAPRLSKSQAIVEALEYLSLVWPKSLRLGCWT